MKFPIPRTPKGRWLAVLTVALVLLAAGLALQRDYATLEKRSPVNLRPVPYDTRGTTMGWVGPGKVRVLGMIMVPEPDAGYGEHPATMVEVRADCGDMKAVHGWLNLGAFSKQDRLRIFSRYHPWTQ